MPLSKTPPTPLREKLTITSAAGLDEAMNQLSWIIARTNEIDAELNNKVNNLKSLLDQDREINAGRRKTTLANYQTELLFAIEEYVRHHSDELFNGKKSFASGPGSISSRKQPEKIAFLDDQQQTLEKLHNTFPIAELLDRFFKQYPELRPFIKFDVKVDQQALLAASKAKSVDGKQLKRFGLKLDQPSAEKITIKAA